MKRSLHERFQMLVMRVLARVPEPWYSWLRDVSNAITFLRRPERVAHPGGDNGLHPDRTFYVINGLAGSVGLATWYDNVLGGMKRAARKGWIPVVARGVTPFGRGGTEDERGDWYTYFAPVSPYSPDDILKFRNVVVTVPHQRVHKRWNRREIAVRHKLSLSAPLNAQAREFVESRSRLLFPDGVDGFTGIYFRGTDYRARDGYCPAGHPAVLEYGHFMDMVEAVLKGWGLQPGRGERLFFVTDEQEALDAFLERYPLAKYIDKPRFSIKGFHTNTPCHVPEGLTFKENNLLYLLDLYALSRCGYLVGPMNGGLMMALNLNGNRYRGVHVLDTGVN